jgi:hypothetical protein
MAIQQNSLEELLQHEPFRPFRILTSSGKEYRVDDPHLVVTMRAEVFYAFSDKDRWAIIPLAHITSVEIDQAA